MNSLTSDFLGSGWKFPVEFDKEQGSVIMLNGDEVIRNSLDVLFATQTGERVMHSHYGSALSSFLFFPITRSTITYMESVIKKEILFNEPRIVLNDIDIQASPTDPARLDIIINYKITATNNRYNYVYPFYLHDATNLAG